MAGELDNNKSSGLPAQDSPRGSIAASIDDKGRLRIPAEYVEYIRSLGDDKVFVTGLDRETARVYPLSVWRKNEAQMNSYGDGDRETAAMMRALALVSQKTGVESAIDGNGRVSISPLLRDLMGFAPKSSVHMTFVQGAFDLETDVVAQRKLQANLDLLMDGMSLLRAKGIK
ncbi:MAG: hypothetical protein FJW31_16585 [Acidobacteria bacterium]|nr:hypothetical protein [Acidobacteriota bacterium]